MDAATGAVLNRFGAIAEGDGTGVKGDTETIDTTPTGDRFRLQSADGPQKTHDAGNLKASESGALTESFSEHDGQHGRVLRRPARAGPRR